MAEIIDQPRVTVSVVIKQGNTVLMVREKKERTRNRWNLPGGHVENGESIIVAAKRELLEETGIEADLSSVIGIYSSNTSVRFVLGAGDVDQIPSPGDEILEVSYIPLSELLEFPDSKLVSPKNLRLIAQHVIENREFSTDLLIDNR